MKRFFDGLGVASVTVFLARMMGHDIDYCIFSGSICCFFFLSLRSLTNVHHP